MAEHTQTRNLIRDALLVVQLLRSVFEACNATNKVKAQLKACTWSANPSARERYGTRLDERLPWIHNWYETRDK